MTRTHRALSVWIVVLCTPAAACTEQRDQDSVPSYAGDIESLLTERCTPCHDSFLPAAGYSVYPYMAATGCVDGQQVVDPPDGSAALLQVLQREDHALWLLPDESERLQAWVQSGAALRIGGVHGTSTLDPRDAGWHGRLAALDHFAPLEDATHTYYCAKCHAGAPDPASKAGTPVPSATDCRTCHDSARGVLDCTTCHGDTGRSYPPRDLCLFPDSADTAGAHAAHMHSALTSRALSCNDCHPSADPELGGSHADGVVDVMFDAQLAGDDASYDEATGRCAVGCHARGGARAQPDWADTQPMACGDCHGSPPADHYVGACDGCHPGTNANGDALLDSTLHLNGSVDLGDGSGGCGACHGNGGDDAWPRQGAHLAHRDSAITTPVACADCHVVPDSVTAPGHLDGPPAEVVLSGRATDRNQPAAFDGASCSAVACHGSGLPDAPAHTPAWVDSADLSCSACHGAPPSPPHPSSEGCESLICHGGEVSHSSGAPRITDPGRALHLNGAIDHSSP